MQERAESRPLGRLALRDPLSVLDRARGLQAWARNARARLIPVP